MTDGDADAVVVGFHRSFDYEELRRACTAVRRGARLIGTNDDVTYPTPDGPIPGGGAILAAVVAGSGVTAVVAGKPYEPMADLVRAELGADLDGAVMVGDRPDTDGRFARAIGCRFGLVFSGVTHRTRPAGQPDPRPGRRRPRRPGRPAPGGRRATGVTARRRLDAELVRRGLVASRAEAQAAVDAGRVTVAGAPALEAGPPGGAGRAAWCCSGPPRRFVSRGGDKLDAALDHFAVDVAGRRALDAGASTGGFTDCLLQRGAAAVVAVDVGHGQLHPRSAADPRVTVRERLNVRALTPDDIGGPVDLVVADLSFISLRTVLAALLGVCRPGRRPGAAGEAPVRGGTGRGVPGPGCDPGRRRSTSRSGRPSMTCSDGAGATIMGWMRVAAAGSRRATWSYFVHARAPGGGRDRDQRRGRRPPRAGRGRRAGRRRRAPGWPPAATRRGCCPRTPRPSAWPSSGPTPTRPSADLAVSLGGDGTVLRTVQLVDGVPDPQRERRPARVPDRGGAATRSPTPSSGGWRATSGSRGA